MTGKSEPNARIEEITDAEISAAIGYLDPDADGGSESAHYAYPDLNRREVSKPNGGAALIGIWTLVLLFCIAAFSCMYHWSR